MSATTMVRERIAPQQVATWSGIVAIPITISWYASTFAALRTYLPSWTSSTLLGAAVFLILLFLIANVFHLRSSRSASSDGDGITRILIVNPHDGERVVHEAVVRGSVTPENTQLQVLVQSGFPNDVWWYPQLPEPWTRGHEWEIDFAEYYQRSLMKMASCHDIEWKPKGTYLVAPPWNFPISIPAGGILAALAIGNCVLFKPAPEAVLSGWILVNALWDAGIPKEALQFINCEDDPVGSKLVKDPRINGVILTGATATARLFLKMRPGLDLSAETGGKNAMIISALSDRDLAIKDLVQSAFGHSGQKCSAASLAILEAEVYDDPHFRKQLKDAVESLTVGSAWDPSSKVIPLIREAAQELHRGLTTLEPGEEWVVKPKQDPQNPRLWSPGVKWGVKEGSFMHQTELFGPVLAVMRAKNLEHAIQIANGTPYGLTSGFHSLDEREHALWLSKIEAGNLYINRTLTGAIVRRQPFGGCKASSYGHGAKAGGPNYVAQLSRPIQKALPKEKGDIPPMIKKLATLLNKIPLKAEELALWESSLSHYALWAHRFKHEHDPSRILGQDNLFQYRPHHHLCFRIQPSDAPLDLLRVCAAALLCETSMHISWTPGETPLEMTSQWKRLMPIFHFIEESEEHFLSSVKQGVFKRVRLLSSPKAAWHSAAAESACYLDAAPVLANGRFELLHYLREVAISYDYHRYGNLGVREGEPRKPLH